MYTLDNVTSRLVGDIFSCFFLKVSRAANGQFTYAYQESLRKVCVSRRVCHRRPYVLNSLYRIPRSEQFHVDNQPPSIVEGFHPLERFLSSQTSFAIRGSFIVHLKDAWRFDGVEFFYVEIYFCHLHLRGGRSEVK